MREPISAVYFQDRWILEGLDRRDILAALIIAGQYAAGNTWIDGNEKITVLAVNAYRLADAIEAVRGDPRETTAARLRREGKDVGDPRNYGVPHPDDEDGPP